MSTSGNQRWVPMLAAMVLALVMVQALVAIMPELYWDVSPLTEPESVPSLALGPAGAAWLTVLSVIVCSLTLLLNKQANQPVQQVALALGLVGIGFASWHMISGDGMDAFRSNAWIGAIALGLAASQLMQHESARRILWAGLLALSIPLFLWAMWAIYVDHPATVKFFLQREAQTITQRGWELNSPQHLIYKRRLMQPEATGVFGFANTFGSIMAATTMLALGAVASHLRQAPRVRVIFTLSLVLLAGGALWLSGARGALLTALLAGGWLLICTWQPHWRKLSMLAAGLLLILPIVVVVIRLMVGPPTTVEGERSLLFRGFYWQGAAQLVVHQPIAQSLIGTGPSSYKDLQTKYKHPLNPEDVASTHNVFIDWVVMLGVGGLAWSMLLLAWMVHAVRRCWQHEFNPPTSKSPEITNRTGMTSLTSIDPRWLGYIVLAALPALVTQFIMQAPAMTLERSLLWLLSAGVFIVLAAMLAQDAWYTETDMRLGITTAALALLVHNQIEMTFFHPGSVTIAMVMLGMAGGLPKSAALAKKEVINHKVTVDASSQDAATNIGGGRRWVWLAAMVLCLMVVTHLAMQTTQVQSSLRQAAESARRMDLATAQRLLQEAIDTRPDPAHARALAEVILAQMQHDEVVPMAIDQIQDELNKTEARLGPRLILLRLNAQLTELAHSRNPAKATASLTVMGWQRVLEHEPYNPRTQLSLARAYEKADMTEQALAGYANALRLSDQLYLDPLAQLGARDREDIEVKFKTLLIPAND